MHVPLELRKTKSRKNTVFKISVYLLMYIILKRDVMNLCYDTYIYIFYNNKVCTYVAYSDGQLRIREVERG